MAQDSRLSRVWDIVERVGVCMLTTHSAAGLRARPLEARPDRAASLIWFVTDLRSAKEDEIEADHAVGLTFIDSDDNSYLSITARAVIRRDHPKTAEIWKATDAMWWSGPDDSNVGVLRVTPLTAELWDGPASNAVAAFEFLKSELPGQNPISARTAKSPFRCEAAAPAERSRARARYRG